MFRPTLTVVVMSVGCAVLGRAERETAYDSRKGDMAKWVAPVQANRQAETLDFAPAVCLYVLMMDVPLAAILELVPTARREVVGLDLPPAAYVHAWHRSGFPPLR